MTGLIKLCNMMLLPLVESRMETLIHHHSDNINIKDEAETILFAILNNRLITNSSDKHKFTHEQLIKIHLVICNCMDFKVMIGLLEIVKATAKEDQKVMNNNY